MPPFARLSLAARLALAAAFTLPTLAAAQGVYRCTVDNRTVYQATPCATEGKSLRMDSAPDPGDVERARARAEADKAKARALDAPPPPPRPTGQERRGDDLAKRTVDCEKLTKDRGDAYGQRIGTIRASRSNNLDNTETINRIDENIRAIERQMRIGGCKID